ncbi:nuclear transport factor 2 family protein [Sphingosinicella sp. CPCC 101087]|uniref:nuclear transport factor 2 family protein n=1 Tax=Sphingosinicella sp. CPCC 101087 TaxID=2497754 RepID=UPI00101C7558|nr:nuclear transport factor 2 family protein [Sphingosinicella sp. CPCC 101087]
MSDEAEIRMMLDRWAAAVRAHDLETILEQRSPDIVMFDVPEPLQAKGLEAYRDGWKLYFGDEGSRLFELRETHIVAGDGVAWVRAILRCTTSPDPAGRLTMGLRKVGGRWVVEHEHHSFPVGLGEGE